MKNQYIDKLFILIKGGKHGLCNDKISKIFLIDYIFGFL